jgi:eukaryotic-like serine/threonine-protein kinase
MSMPAADRWVANRYALKAPLGRGGMGVVWRAHDAVLGREVAVKEVVFPPAMADDEQRQAQARVMREARAAARLNHPGVVTLYDVIQDHGGTFIVMELVDAPTLADLVRANGPLPVERVAEIGAQVASALEAAHAAGIVHRDVKPGNVMVPDRGPAKLADFGIASLQGDPQLTSTGLVIGSPAYMAPEQAKGEESGPPADFWALGATMFYAVEGEPPFDRGTSIATLAAVVNDPTRTPRRAGALTPLITALLSKDPGSRPSGPELRAEFGRLVAARPALSTEVLPVHGPGRTIPQPAASDDTPRPTAPVPPSPPPSPAASTPAGAVDNREQPTPPSATRPLRETSQPEVGVAPAGAAAAGTAAAEAAAATEAPEREGSPGDRAAAEGPVAAPHDRPARPLLPPAPVVDRPGRGRMVGVLALLVVLGLAAVLFAVNLRSGGDGEPTKAPGTTAAAGGGARASETTRPATPTTEAPQTTGAPATTAAPGGLPAGWTSFTNERGASRVGVPPGFRAHTRERFNATVVEEQRGDRRVFTVRSQNPSAQLPQASRDYRAGAPERFAGYREVSYQENQTYAGHKGAVVFEYEAVVDGRRVHVSHINFKGRTWGYNVEFIVPAARWDASKGLARQFEQAFQALG